MKVLLVESDQILATTIANLLASSGHETTAIADAQAAVTATDGLEPDVIIMDLLLAGRSGVEFLYELRSYTDWQKIPVVIYASLPESELPIESSCFAELDIARYFYKPTTKLSDLLDSINALAPAAV